MLSLHHSIIPSFHHSIIPSFHPTPPPMTRNGKIARLPRSVRDELNCRLDEGQEGVELVAWLNQHPEVQRVMAASFAGRPITEGNLTEWKQRGFVEWKRHQESC